MNQIVIKGYLKHLKRMPDRKGLNTYSRALRKGRISEAEFEKILSSSDEANALNASHSDTLGLTIKIIDVGMVDTLNECISAVKKYCNWCCNVHVITMNGNRHKQIKENCEVVKALESVEMSNVGPVLVIPSSYILQSEIRESQLRAMSENDVMYIFAETNDF